MSRFKITADSMGQPSAALRYVLVGVAIAFWSVSIVRAELGLGDYGLIQSLGPLFWIAFSLLTLSFLLNMFSSTISPSILCLHVITLVLFLHLTPVLIERSPRWFYGYVNYSAVDYLLRHGHTNPDFSVYHEWPAFPFLAVALHLVPGIDGFWLLLLTPIISALLLYVPIIRFVYSCLGANPREAWGAAYVFFMMFWNWNTFMLRNFAILMLLLTLGTLFKTELNHNQKGRLEWRVILIVLFSAMVLSHGFFTLSILVPLGLFVLVFRYLSKKWRLNFMIFYTCLALSWVLYGAFTRFSGQLPRYIDQILQMQVVSATSSLISKVSPARLTVIRIRVGGMAWFCGLALLGFLHQCRSHRRLPAQVLLATTWVVGSGLIPLLGSYAAQEMLGFATALAAVPLAFLAIKNIHSRSLSVLLIAYFVTAPWLSMIGIYGNELIDYVSPSEIAGVDFLEQNSTDVVHVKSISRRILGYQSGERFRPERLRFEDLEIDNANYSETGRPYYLLVDDGNLRESYFSRQELTQLAQQLQRWLNTAIIEKVYDNGASELFRCE